LSVEHFIPARWKEREKKRGRARGKEKKRNVEVQLLSLPCKGERRKMGRGCFGGEVENNIKPNLPPLQKRKKKKGGVEKKSSGKRTHPSSKPNATQALPGPPPFFLFRFLEGKGERRKSLSGEKKGKKRTKKNSGLYLSFSSPSAFRTERKGKREGGRGTPANRGKRRGKGTAPFSFLSFSFPRARAKGGKGKEKVGKGGKEKGQ